MLNNEALSMSAKTNAPSTGSIRVLKLRAVVEKVQLSADTIYRGVREGWFPGPFKIGGGRASGWYEHEIDAYLARRASERIREVRP